MREGQDADPNTCAAQVGHREIDEDRAANPRLAVTYEDRRGGHECHQLPKGKEGGGVARGYDPGEGEQKQAAEDHLDATIGRIAEVVASVQDRRHRNDCDRRQEEAAEPVDSQRRAEAIAELGARRRSAEQDEAAGDPDQSDPQGLQRQRETTSRAKERRHGSGSEQE